MMFSSPKPSGIAAIILLSLCFASLCLVGCSKTPDAESVRIFSAAQNSFEEAEKLPPEEQKAAFRLVAQTYQSLIDNGVKSGAIYYNMGNAWARCDEIGQAVAAYRTAKRYMPLDPYIASNLQALGASESPKPIIEHVLFWQDWIGIRQKYIVSFLAIASAFIVGITALFYSHQRIKRTFWFFLTLALISLISTGYDCYRFEYSRYAVVSVQSATPRKGNSEQYELTFTTPVSLGTTAQVLDERGDWVRLRFAADQDGWLPKNQIVLY